jgi:hypothetical protein
MTLLLFRITSTPSDQALGGLKGVDLVRRFVAANARPVLIGRQNNGPDAPGRGHLDSPNQLQACDKCSEGATKLAVLRFATSIISLSTFSWID